MKIGIDGRLWNESGVGRYIRGITKKLDEKRDLKHQFVVFLKSSDFEKVKFSNSNIKKIKADVRWHGLSEQWKFKKIIESADLDLMHFTYFSYPVLYKKPFVITIHDLIIDHYPTGKASSLPFPVYNIKHFAYRKITALAIKNSKKIIVPSFASKNEIIDHYHADSKKIEVIYEAFDKDISKDTNSFEIPYKNFILYVGNAYPHKNIPVLLKSFAIMREKIKDINLICIGRDDFFYRNIEKIDHQGVKFLHGVDDSKLFEYYRHASFLVMPSLMEGFGLPVLEAMSLSLPAICSNTPALKEIGGEAVLYFDPNNASELAQKMILLLNDHKLTQRLIDKGLERSKQFSSDKTLNETLRVYESCNSV